MKKKMDGVHPRIVVSQLITSVLVFQTITCYGETRVNLHNPEVKFLCIPDIFYKGLDVSEGRSCCLDCLIDWRFKELSDLYNSSDVDIINQQISLFQAFAFLQVSYGLLPVQRPPRLCICDKSISIVIELPSEIYIELPSEIYIEFLETVLSLGLARRFENHGTYSTVSCDCAVCVYCQFYTNMRYNHAQFDILFCGFESSQFQLQEWFSAEIMRTLDSNFPLLTAKKKTVTQPFSVSNNFHNLQELKNAVLLHINDKSRNYKIQRKMNIKLSVIPNCQRFDKSYQNVCYLSKVFDKGNGTACMIISDIVTVSVSTQNSSEVNTRVHITFSRLLSARGSTAVQCVFWDASSRRWSNRGCRVVSSNSSHLCCFCDHLTSFAILVNVVNGTQLTANKAQTVLTIVSCCVSTFCLFMICFTFTYFTSLASHRTMLHRNLSACLLGGNILFLFSNVFEGDQTVCIAIAELTHFMFLSAFCWMLVEGTELLLLFARPKAVKSHMPNWSQYTSVVYAGCFLAPMVIVIILAGFFNCYDQQFCWLTVDRGCIWGFVGPMMVVIVINCAAFSCTLSTMIKHTRSSQAMKHRTLTRKIQVWVKGVSLLLSVLGIPWIVGVFEVNKGTLIFSYLFILFNTTQGLFMFVLYCVLNDKVRLAYLHLAFTSNVLPEKLKVYLQQAEKKIQKKTARHHSVVCYAHARPKATSDSYDKVLAEFYQVEAFGDEHENVSGNVDEDSDFEDEEENRATLDANYEDYNSMGQQEINIWNRFFNIHRKSADLEPQCSLSGRKLYSSRDRQLRNSAKNNHIYGLLFGKNSESEEVCGPSGSLFTLAFSENVNILVSKSKSHEKAAFIKRLSAGLKRKSLTGSSKNRRNTVLPPGFNFRKRTSAYVDEDAAKGSQSKKDREKTDRHFSKRLLKATNKFKFLNYAKKPPKTKDETPNTVPLKPFHVLKEFKDLEVENPVVNINRKDKILKGKYVLPEPKTDRFYANKDPSGNVKHQSVRDSESIRSGVSESLGQVKREVDLHKSASLPTTLTQPRKTSSILVPCTFLVESDDTFTSDMHGSHWSLFTPSTSTAVTSRDKSSALSVLAKKAPSSLSTSVDDEDRPNDLKTSPILDEVVREMWGQAAKSSEQENQGQQRANVTPGTISTTMEDSRLSKLLTMTPRPIIKQDTGLLHLLSGQRSPSILVRPSMDAETRKVFKKMKKKTSKDTGPGDARDK